MPATVFGVVVSATLVYGAGYDWMSDLVPLLIAAGVVFAISVAWLVLGRLLRIGHRGGGVALIGLLAGPNGCPRSGQLSAS